MNRPARAANDKAANVAEELRRALELFRAGRADETEKIHRRLLKDHPNNPDVLSAASAFFLRMSDAPVALKALKKLVIQRPEDPAVMAQLGDAYYQTREYAKARGYLEKSLEAAPFNPVAKGLLGLSLHRMGDFAGAEDLYRQALQSIESTELRNRLAETLIRAHRDDEALELLEEAVNRKTFDYDALVRLSFVQTQKEPVSAMATAIKAIFFDPARDDAKSLLAIAVSLGVLPGETDPKIAEAVSHCLRCKRAGANDLAMLWLLQVFAPPEARSARELIDARNYEDFKKLYASSDFRDALLIPLFIEGVHKILIFNPETERLITHLRRYYCEACAQGSLEVTNPESALLESLAVQSYFNEFICDETPAETATVESLKEKIEAGKASALETTLYAAYRPLRDLRNAGALRAPPAVMNAHIIEPNAVETAKKKIKSFGSITDAVSRKVRAQYEENPYPAWRDMSYFPVFEEGMVARGFAPRKKILIAGCGTGKHILISHALYPHAEFTAIDLSAASLAYAAIKCADYGLKDVKLLQGDLLEIGTLGQTYDVVDASGVLHHMADPEKGLKALVDVLKPGGSMRIGLYSARARSPVVTMKNIIETQGFSPTLAGIRAARAWIKAAPEDQFDFFTTSRDFYAASSCRDLMFHTQETTFTLPEIEKMLARAGLVFECLLLPPHRLAQYRAKYPQDKKGTDLANWDAFERENPSFFSGMYNIRAKKE